MIGSIDAYAPCFCGSGKKYRFCCLSHINQLATNIFEAKLGRRISSECAVKADELLDQGYELLEKHNYDEADKLFHQVLELNPYLMAAYNNLAISSYARGKSQEAIDILRKAIAETTMQEPFTLAFLAQLLYMKGEDDAAKNAAFIAANQARQSTSSIVKVCEALATLRLHREILDFVDYCDSMDDDLEDDCFFFAGVASANLHDYSRARKEFSAITIDSPRSPLAKRYLTMLENGEKPNSISGDWLYFPPEHFLVGINPDDLAATDKFFKKGRWIADMVEVFMVDQKKMRTEKTIELLHHAEHPSIGKFLRKIADWPLADEKLCFSVLSIMSSRGEITDAEASKILGQRHFKDYGEDSALFNTVRLNPELRHGGTLPEGCFEQYKSLIHNMRQENPDWINILAGLNELCQKHPDFFPFQYNRGAALLAMGEKHEAEEIFRRLADEHPEYLFAHSGILNILIEEKRLDEAEEYIKKTKMPGEVHPDAFISYNCACARYYLYVDKDHEAKKIMAFLKKIDPDHPDYLSIKKIMEEKKVFDMFLKATKKLAKLAEK